MTMDNFDVMKLADEVEKDSQSGTLTLSLLTSGNVLYSPDPDMPNHLRRLSPSGRLEIGIFSNGRFIATSVIREEGFKE